MARTLIQIPCAFCGTVHTIEVDAAGMLKRMGGASIQECFPDMSPEMREMFVSRVCPTCWEKTFSEPDEDNGLSDAPDEAYKGCAGCGAGPDEGCECPRQEPYPDEPYHADDHWSQEGDWKGFGTAEY